MALDPTQSIPFTPGVNCIPIITTIYFTSTWKVLKQQLAKPDLAQDTWGCICPYINYGVRFLPWVAIIRVYPKQRCTKWYASCVEVLVLGKTSSPVPGYWAIGFYSFNRRLLVCVCSVVQGAIPGIYSKKQLYCKYCLGLASQQHYWSQFY